MNTNKLLYAVFNYNTDRWCITKKSTEYIAIPLDNKSKFFPVYEGFNNEKLIPIHNLLERVRIANINFKEYTPSDIYINYAVIFYHIKNITCYLSYAT